MTDLPVDPTPGEQLSSRTPPWSGILRMCAKLETMGLAGPARQPRVLHASPWVLELGRALTSSLDRERFASPRGCPEETRRLLLQLAAVFERIGVELALLRLLLEADQDPAEAPIAEAIEDLLARHLTRAVRTLERLAARPPAPAIGSAREEEEILRGLYAAAVDENSLGADQPMEGEREP